MLPTRNLLRKISNKFTSRPTWSFELDYALWADQINTPQSEELSGIYKKIELLKEVGKVEIIGGINTNSSDDIFIREDGELKFRAQLEDYPNDTYLLIYSPHPFWTNAFGQDYRWIPAWSDLYSIFYHNPDWKIYQYSPTFDSAGRYFFIAHKTPKSKHLITSSQLSTRTFHVFYFQEGGDLTLSKSNLALSAHLCSTLSLLGAKVNAHDMNDISALNGVNTDDVLIGHVGSWVKNASERGFKNIVLYNPANQWYPTRRSEYFESNATIAEQVGIAKLVIAQSGAVWRMTSGVIEPEKWRWIDLGVDPYLFPKTKKSFNQAGKRKFLFFHLYDDAQKGADIASGIIQSRPSYEFISINGNIRRYPNVRHYPRMANTGKQFRNLLTECDFVLLPSREDAQPGSLIEAASIGLIPVATYTSGYSISFPRIIAPNNIENWTETLDVLQHMEDKKLVHAQNFIQHYLNAIHNWHNIGQLIEFYLREFI